VSQQQDQARAASADQARIASSPVKSIGGGFGGSGSGGGERYDNPSSLEDPYTKAALDKLSQVGKEGLITPGDVADQEAGIASQSQAAANARQQQINRLAGKSGEVAGSAALQAATLRNQQARQNQTIAGQADVRRAATETNRTAQTDALTKAAEFRLRQLAQEPKQLQEGPTGDGRILRKPPATPTTGGPMPLPEGNPIPNVGRFGPESFAKKRPTMSTMGPL
jgi:hypothetical protein